MIVALSPDTGQPIAIGIEGERVSSVSKTTRDSGGVWAAPGFIDLQVNGFGGVDYNSPTASRDEIAGSIRMMRSTGVTRFLPTVITGAHERMRAALRNLAVAREALPDEGRSIAGFHVEGPWISPEDGPRGAHPREHVREPDKDEFLRLQEAAGGAIRMVTLAPELPGALPMIEFLVAKGVVVSIGHTGASEGQIRDAIRAGASMATHVGNGAHPVLPKHANYIWEQLAADELHASFIADGIHLPPSFLKSALRAKGLERSVLVTDATAAAGCSPGRYRIGEINVELTAENRVQIGGTNRLAGSALRMDQAVENVMRTAGLSLAQALRPATANPARAARLDGRQGFLEAGEIADLVLFHHEASPPRISIIKTIVGGSE